MTIYTLYVKTHKITGMKYLGQTTKDPLTYKGSGIDWKHHLRENGYEVTTEILYQGHDREEMKRLGRYYSDLWKVTEDSRWANRIPETGGGTTPSEKTRKILREQQLGRKKPPRTKEHRLNLSASLKGKSNPKTANGLKKYFESNPDRSEALQKLSTSVTKWYSDNPEKAKDKANKTWNSKCISNYDYYVKIVELVLQGKGIKTIKKLTGHCPSQKTVRAIRDKSHRIFTLFPVLKQLPSS